MICHMCIHGYIALSSQNVAQFSIKLLMCTQKVAICVLMNVVWGARALARGENLKFVEYKRYRKALN